MKMTIAEYKKLKEIPEIREWKRKFQQFYYAYELVVYQYQERMITFSGFMKELKRLNSEWKAA